MDGNVFAFLRCLHQDPGWDRWQAVVSVTKDTRAAAEDRFRALGFSRVRTVIRNSAPYKKCLATAGILITDNSFPPYFIKREEQVYLNTWHGTPLKRLGRADISNSTSIGNVQKNLLMADYLLFPNTYTRDIMLQDYMIDRLYKGSCVLTDYPRNDALHDKQRLAAVRKRYGLEGKRIYAYMPTWRGTGRSADKTEQVRVTRRVLEEIEGLLQEDELLYVNLHFLIGNQLDLTGLTRTRFFPEELETYDFLGVCDVLISDYSSVMMDYAQLGRPIVMYMYDYETYLQEKGFYFDIRQLPFRQAYDMHQLQQALEESRRFLAETDFPGGGGQEGISEQEGRDGSREAGGKTPAYTLEERFRGKHLGSSTRKMLKLLCLGRQGELEVRRHQPDPESVLIYAGDLEHPATRALTRHHIEGLSDQEREHTVIAFESEVGDETAAFLAELDPRVHFLRCIGGGAILLQEYVYLNLYRNHGLCARRAGRYLDREYRRLFAFLGCGELQFLSTNVYERMGAAARADHTAFHRIPLYFYRRLNDVFYAHPRQLGRVVSGFDRQIQHPQDLGLDWAEGDLSRGFYARADGFRIRTREEMLVLEGQLQLRSSISLQPSAQLQISSRVYEEAFCYPLKIEAIGSGKRWEGGAVVCDRFRFRCRIPLEETRRWYVSNMVSIGFRAGERTLMIPLLSRGSGKLFQPRLTDLPGTGKVCEIRREFRYMRLMLRERLVTDDRSQRIKLAAAFALHLITPWYKPVMLYEKNCNSYEESASVLYEQLMDDGRRDVWYILNRDYPHREKVRPDYERRIADQFSLRHYYVLFSAVSLISSEALGHSLERGSTNGLFRSFVIDGSKNYVFLQHGVMYMVSLDAGQRAFFRKGEGKGKHRVVVSSEREADHFTSCTNYLREDIYVCGLLKFDRSRRDADADRIVIMPTWRPWEFVQGLDDIRSTGYYRMLQDMVAGVPEELRDHLIVLPHPLIAEQFGADSGDPVLRYCHTGESYDDILRKTAVLITDYSSISYDAFYRGCRVVFYWKDRDACMKEYGDAHLMLTEDLAFGPVCWKAEDLSKAIGPAFAREQTGEEQERYRQIVTWQDGGNTRRFIQMARKDGIL